MLSPDTLLGNITLGRQVRDAWSDDVSWRCALVELFNAVNLVCVALKSTDAPARWTCSNTVSRESFSFFSFRKLSFSKLMFR